MRKGEYVRNILGEGETARNEERGRDGKKGRERAREEESKH